MTLNIAVIVGSNRKDSINRKYAKALANLGQGKANFNFIDIAALPMFNEDLEKDTPAQALAFGEAVSQNDAVLMVTPEYNRSIPALLKNAIDWGSRKSGQGAWKRPIAITGTTPGAIGTAAVQQHLRAVMGDIGGSVLPGEVYFTYKDGIFDEQSNVTNEDTKKFLQGFVDRFINFAEKLK